jgi:hypothetical protein
MVQADKLSQSLSMKEASEELRGLLRKFKSFEIIFLLHVLENFLSVTQQLLLQMHATQLDIDICRRVD